MIRMTQRAMRMTPATTPTTMPAISPAESPPSAVKMYVMEVTFLHLTSLFTFNLLNSELVHGGSLSIGNGDVVDGV